MVLLLSHARRQALGFLRKLNSSVALFERGVRLLAAGSHSRFAFFIGLIVVTGLLPVTQVWLSKLVVDGIAGEAIPADVLVLASLYALTFAASSGLEPLLSASTAWLEDRAVGRIDRALMDAGASMVDLYQIERPELGDRIQVLDTAVFFLPKMFLAAQSLFRQGITVIGILFLLGGLSPVLPVVLTVLTIPHLLTVGKTRLLVYQEMKAKSRAAREMEYCVRLATEPRAAKEMRVFGAVGFFIERFDGFLRTALSEMTDVRLRALRSSAVFVGLHGLALGGGLWYVAVGASAGHLTLGDVAMYSYAVIQAQVGLVALPLWSGLLLDVRSYLRDLFDFVDGAGSRIKLPEAGLRSALSSRAGEALRFEGVCFRYPDCPEPVLTNVCFTIPAGKVTAIVGANGAGKSTLVKLLTRMYDPDHGVILLSGKSLSHYDLESLRARIAVVYQDFAHFALTLRENIAVGASSASRGSAQVEVAAQWAGVDKVASGLPKGYDTELTRTFEGGTELSGGEWQKVALARGFIRDASILILDEPTSSLDADAEHTLLEQFRELRQGKTTLLISHRLSSVMNADQIVVLEDGRVIEIGTHSALIADKGHYARLFHMQSSRFN